MTTCPNCPAEVIEATLPAGTVILLQPRPSPRGDFAAAEGTTGWLARYLAPGREPNEGEKRYAPHGPRCGAREEWQQARSAAFHRQRAQRGRRQRRGTYDGAAGIRIPPPHMRIPPGGDR